MDKCGKNKIKYMILTLAVIIGLTFVFCQNLSYEYEPMGERIEVLEESYISASGYDVTYADGGRRFKMNADDPQIYFDLSKKDGLGQIGGLEIEMVNIESDDYEIPIQVFYAKSGDSFSERNSVSMIFSANDKEMLIPIPPGIYEKLRIDIDGTFELHGVNVYTEKMLEKPYISDITKKRCMWLFPVVIIWFPLIAWAHGKRRKKGEHMLLGMPLSEKREAHWDYMRILAAALVILAHACSPMVTQLEETGGADWKRFVLICGLSIGLTCNLLYVMLSGALLLGKPSKSESVSDFYIRRSSRVIIPLAAYYMLLLYLNDEVSFFPPENIGVSLKRIVTGAPDAAPHLWLIYTIISLYIVTPFFRLMVSRLSDKMLMSLASVIIVLNILTGYLPLFGMTFGAATFLGGWEGIFLLGLILSKRAESGKSDKDIICYMAGVAAFAVTVAVVFYDSLKMNYVYNNTPTMVLMSCAVFSLFLKYKERLKFNLNSRLGKAVSVAVRICSKYSYSIILIHWYVLFVIVQGRLHITALRFGCFGGIFATVVLTFVICLFIAIVFDNTVVIVCNAVFDSIIHIFKKHTYNKA